MAEIYGSLGQSKIGLNSRFAFAQPGMVNRQKARRDEIAVAYRR